MKTVLRTLKRATGPVLVAGLVVASTATPAAAQTPGSTAYRIFGGFAGVQANSGFRNHVMASMSGGHLILSDTAGIAAGPGCTRVIGSTTSADCGSIATVTRLGIQLGDQDDSAVINVPVNSLVDAGTGVDSVTTNGGNDTISVQDGAGGDSVTCGAGSDTVYADSTDTVAGDCEVKHIV
jgi:Ca2+-binding RTX toxin-like protein